MPLRPRRENFVCWLQFVIPVAFFCRNVPTQRPNFELLECDDVDCVNCSLCDLLLNKFSLHKNSAILML
jgi:hypothetical protein